MTGEQIKSIEERFGFKYDYRFFNIPQDYLNNKNTKYNNVVYEYLDSINNFDTRKEIDIEFNRYSIENLIISNINDRNLKKVVWKEFQKQDKKHREIILRAEKLYRDREFEKALKIYKEIEEKIITEKGKIFILNSKYHSLMNLEKFKEACELLLLDNMNWIDKRLKYKNLP